MMTQQLSQSTGTSTYSRVETHETMRVETHEMRSVQTRGREGYPEELRRIEMETRDELRSTAEQKTANVPCVPEGSSQRPAVPQLPMPQNPTTTTAVAAAPKPKSPGLVARPVGFVLDHLPSVLSGRVQPLYESYAAPAVEKVDDVLDRIVTGAQSRIAGTKAAAWTKVKSRDDVAGMNKPSLAQRLMAAAERGVDRVLPPARKSEADPATPSTDSGDSEDLEKVTFRRLTSLVDTVRTRAYVHTEVKYIVMKVKARVWVDVNITRRCRALAARARALPARAKARALASKEACLGYEKRAETYVAGKYNTAKSTAGEYSTMLATRTSALKNKGVARTTPYVDGLKLRVKPITDRLTAFVQKLLEMERACVGYAVAKKNMVKDYAVAKKTLISTRAKAKIAPVEEYVAEKYDSTRSTAATLTTRTMNSAQAIAEKVLGRERSRKLGGLLGKYTATIARAVHPHSA